LLNGRQDNRRLQEVTVPRYRIELSASAGQWKPCARNIWANDDDAAVSYAKTWLAYTRNRFRDRAGLDTWEVTTGIPPYSRRTPVAMGHLQARR
jgi:hypothetical protein